jgi:glycosyltransferase involved in cell wall biosynthesis
MPYRLAFVMEQTLGHITHAQNFRNWVSKDPDVIATWIPVSYEAQDRWDSVPVVRGNWTLRASIRAREQLVEALRSTRLDALFFHTQVTSIFSRRLMARIPTVVSMDATPLNFDTIGGPYAHQPSRYTKLEAFKNAMNRRSFHGARKLITWNQWGKASLVRDYGVDAEKVVVIPPGVDLDKWKLHRAADGRRPVRILFVGGDFRRKGGEILLAAFRNELQDCELDIVTRDPVDVGGLPGVRVHNGLGPNAAALIALYEQADLFAFPTFADVLPIVVMEAMAAGLPVITTSVGAVSEQIQDGVTGFLIPPNDSGALAAVVRRLVLDPTLRTRVGTAARQEAERLFNGALNYERLLAVCKRCVDAD